MRKEGLILHREKTSEHPGWSKSLLIDFPSLVCRDLDHTFHNLMPNMFCIGVESIEKAAFLQSARILAILA